MGAAISSNTASAITNVLNYVQQSTNTNTNAVSSIQDNVNFNNCYIDLTGDFSIETAATVSQTANQIVSAAQNTTLQNDIVQKMLQEATSKVGSLGIGYAEATNATSQLCNITNQILNTMNSSINQFSTIDNSFTCNSSTIKAKNLSINFTNENNFVAEQTIANSQINDITNSVTQSSEQKASATVQGLAGLLIAIALIIAALGYAIAKPLASGGKSILIPGIVLLVFIVVIWLYMVKAPPFFSEYIYVSPNTSTNFGGSCKADSLKQLEVRSEKLKNPPLKYNFPLVPSAARSGDTKGNLLTMYVSSLKGDKAASTSENAGYNLSTLNQIKDKDNELYWNIDANNQVQFKAIFGEDYGNSKNRLPNPLICLSYTVNNEVRYARMSSIFAETCSPQIVQFTNDYDDTGTVTGDEAKGTCNFTVAEYNTGDGSSCEQDMQDCSVQCCNSKFFDITRWVNGDSDFYTKSKEENTTKIICNVNLKSWDSYLYPEDPKLAMKRQLYARFWLGFAVGIPVMDIYINDDELVQLPTAQAKTNIQVAKDVKDKAYLFSEFTPPASNNYASSINSGGIVTGVFGICNDQTYKFQSFCKNAGGYILIVLIVGVVAFIALKGTSLFSRRGGGRGVTVPKIELPARKTKQQAVKN